MNEEHIVLVAEGCPHCGAVTEQARRKFGEVTVLDVTKQDRGAQLAMKLKVRAVPTVVRVQHTEKGTKLCVLDESGETEKCVNE